jgi:Kef-type K+ transport system membrane component KefB
MSPEVNDVTRTSTAGLLLRMFVVVPPAQVVGILLAAPILAGSGLLQQAPWLGILISICSGAVSGVALGLLLTPPIGRHGTFLAVTAAFGLAVWALLAVLAELRVSGSGAGPAWYAYLLGAVSMVTVQSLMTWSCWVARSRRSLAHAKRI